MKKLCFFVAAMLLSWNAAADTFYVDLSGSNTPPYNTPATAAHSLQAAINQAANGDMISIAAGTYNEGPQILIDRNLVIFGAGQGLTIFKPTANTGSSGDARGWFLVPDGVELHLSDMTLDGTGFLVWQAIRHKGSGTIEDVHFTQIKFNESGPNYAGTAVAAFGATAAIVDISNCTFDEIGRIGVQYFGGGVNGSVIQSCQFTGKGAGDWLDYAVEAGGGAQVELRELTISGNRGVASSDGSTSAGVLGSEYFGAGTAVTVVDCDISDCTTGIFLGFEIDNTGGTISSNAIYSNGTGIRTLSSNVVINNCNQIYSNTNFGVNNTSGGTITATGNWWGDASGPSGSGTGSGDAVSADVLFDPWGNNANCDILVPVELLTFAAELTDDGVRLSWATASETENLGFHIYRSSSAEGEYTRLNDTLIPGAGSSAETHHYSFTDATVEAGNTYWYRLADVDFNGRINLHGPVEVTVDAATSIGDDQGLPQTFALQQNYPNPFNPSTTISFALPQASEVSLAIYSLSGQLIKQLAAGQMGAGYHRVVWDGTDARGLRVASGVYLYVIRAGDYLAQKKLVLAK